MTRSRHHSNTSFSGLGSISRGNPAPTQLSLLPFDSHGQQAARHGRTCPTLRLPPTLNALQGLRRGQTEALSGHHLARDFAAALVATTRAPARAARGPTHPARLPPTANPCPALSGFRGSPLTRFPAPPGPGRSPAASTASTQPRRATRAPTRSPDLPLSPQPPSLASP
jgi:hypothetical protein